MRCVREEGEGSGVHSRGVKVERKETVMDWKDEPCPKPSPRNTERIPARGTQVNGSTRVFEVPRDKEDKKKGRG